MSDITQTDIHNALRNEGYGVFTLGNREFPIKDLSYDDYIEFCELARPIIGSVAASLELNPVNGEMSLAFNPLNMDFAELLKLAGKELPRMAWICCRQSDPKIKIDDVKKLGRRPMALLEVVLMQIQHNGLVKEFGDFFPRIAAAVSALVPQAQEAMTPVSQEQLTTTTE